jgi:hypothetical protein
MRLTRALAVLTALAEDTTAQPTNWGDVIVTVALFALLAVLAWLTTRKLNRGDRATYAVRRLLPRTRARRRLPALRGGARRAHVLPRPPLAAQLPRGPARGRVVTTEVI